MFKKNNQTQQGGQMAEVYPCYLSNLPEGVDLFEGKSQERLADAMAMHITETDKVEKPIFARLIGLEGKWGSGKSNVIKMLEEELKDSYTFFCFDAWGNQEDLQRRSILELLTKYLIEKGKLAGKTKMRILSPKSDGKLIEEECTWGEKLETLLSRKSYTKDITVPSLNSATKWFVLVLLLMGLFVTYLSVDNTGEWWANLLIALSPMVFFTVGMLITKSSWRKMFDMYNTEGRSDTTSYVISEQEPSVREFKDWMKEISNGIPETDRLVLVFDNMDRLPSEKVHQFWSLIQTFFADVENSYKNIWCIVPYDEKHLAAVFIGEGNKEESVQLLRGFLNKTFPVSYRVPEPIVADYKMIFEQLFHKAFGDTVGDEDVDAISRCYRHIHSEPNVREMITFINSNVVLAKEWGKTVHPLSIAIYVLKSDSMLRNPKVTMYQNGKKEEKDTSTEEYLLANEYYSEFRNLLFGHPSTSYLQREIAAIVYGVEPIQAQQIVVKRHIRNCMADKENKLTFDQYINTPRFMLLLDEDVHNMEIAEYERAVMLIDKIDAEKLSQKDKSRLESIWKYLGRQFNVLKSQVSEYSNYHSTLFKHLSPADAKVCATTFCQSLVSNKEVDGSKLFDVLTMLFESDFAKTYTPADICPSIEIEPKRFADYVENAGYDYKRFPLYSDTNELNSFLENAVTKEFPYLFTLKLLKDDDKYTVSEVGEYAVRQLEMMKADAPTAVNYISIQRVFYNTFQSKINAEYINTLWQSVQNEQGSPIYQEVYAIKSREGFEQLPEDDAHINSLIEKVPFYLSTSNLIILYLQNVNISYRRKLLIKMLNENNHTGHPDYPEFVENWQNLSKSLGVSKETIIRFADSWGYCLLPNQAKQSPYFTLLSDVAWIDALIAANTPLAKELLTKCVAEMAQQPKDQYLQPNTANHTNNSWSQALQKLVATNYITQSSFNVMVDIAVSLLDYVAKNSSFGDATWKQMLAKVDYASISSSFMVTRNNILNGQPGYVMNPSKFLQLHEWLEQSEINTADHCTDAANQILAKVIDDVQCQAVILAKRDYYRPIIANTKGTASVLHEKLKAILQNHSETEFSKYIQETVKYQ